MDKLADALPPASAMSPGKSPVGTPPAVNTAISSPNPRRMRLSPLPKSMWGRQQMETLQRDVEKIDKRLREQIRKCLNAEADWPLLMHGPPGTGKTLASLCVLDRYGGVYWTMQSLCDSLIAAQHGKLNLGRPGMEFNPGPEYLWEKIGVAQVVVLDEIGVRSSMSDFQYNTLKRLLDMREHRASIFVSNLSPMEMTAIYDDRLLSRLFCGTRFVFAETTKDRRTSS